MKTIKMMLVIFCVAFITSSSYADEHNIYQKDCSHLKKLHKKLMCKAGSDKYNSERTETAIKTDKVKKNKGESFNEKYNSLSDVLEALKKKY